MDPVVPSAAGARGAAADVADAEAAETERSFSDLPELALHAIGAACYPDAKQLLRLSLACRAARGLDCEAIWRDWVKRRFGDAALPPEPPAGPVRAAELEGFLFFQGMEPSPATAVKTMPPGSSLEQMAEAAKEAGAQAFTTGGAIFRSLPLQEDWRRASLDPREGMYVTAAAARAMQLDEKPAAPVDTWPPRADPSQWVYFPGVDAARANGDPRSTMDMVQHADSIEPLLAGRVPPSFPVAAVTTDGKLLRTLRPQWAWRELGDWGRGLYVKESVARTMQLREPRVDMTPEERADELKRRYVRRSALAVEAQDMDVVWLDGNYLSLQGDTTRPVPGLGATPPAGRRAQAEAVVELRSVCWLELAGEITGVLPGTYQVAWCTDMSRAQIPETDPINLWASVEVADSSTAGSGGGGSGGRVETKVSCTLRDIRRLPRQHSPGFGWGWMAGPVVRVPSAAAAAPARVRVKLYCHTGSWKSSIRWAFAQLLPVAPGEERAALPPLTPEAAAAAAAGSSARGGAGGSGALNTGLVAAAAVAMLPMQLRHVFQAPAAAPGGGGLEVGLNDEFEDGLDEDEDEGEGGGVEEAAEELEAEEQEEEAPHAPGQWCNQQ